RDFHVTGVQTCALPILQEPLSIGRVLGRFTADEAGPGLIITAGVHGNEPSGIIAFKKVWQGLMQMQPKFKGELTGLAGNLAALKIGRAACRERIESAI